MEGLSIVGIHKSFDGRKAEAYKLSNGEIVTVAQACSLCDSGALPGYITASRWDGDRYIRTRPDRSRANNLHDLPEF